MSSKKKTTKKKQRKFVIVTKGFNYWKPEVDDVIEGTFVEIMEKPDDFNKGQVQKFATIFEDGNEEKQVAMPSTKVMNDFFGDLEKGTYVRVTYLGKKSKKGKEKSKHAKDSYHTYKLEQEEA